LPSAAREILTPEEQAERELERKRQAEPVLECSPSALEAKVTQGQTSILHLTIGNTGGRTLRWSVLSAPKWVRLDRMSGKLGFEEEERLVLVADPEGLPGGIASGKIVVAAPGAEGSPATVALALDVPAPPPSETPAAGPTPSGPGSAVPAPPVVPKTPRAWRLGLMVAAIEPMPGSAREYHGSPPMGILLIRFGANGTRRKGIEFGAGLAEFYSEEDGEEELWSRLIIWRTRALFPVVGGLHLTAGGQIVSEEADYPGTDYKEHTRGTLDAGAMYRLGGHFELSASYSYLVESRNVPGMMEFGLAVTF
jgi:hypothetical protein